VRVLILAFLVALFGSGCTSTATRDGTEVYDPFENANRAIFKFNSQADRFVLRPIASGYHRVTPDPVERGISRFFDNLSSPIIIVSDLLQGKFNQAGADTGRFLINSTAGLLGFLDVARHMGLEQHDEDIGQTFGKWGIGQGPYLMVPFLGPFSLRDGFGRVLELPLEPIRYIDDDEGRLAMIALYSIDARMRLLAADDALATAFDPYIFLRDAYLQRRRYLVYDGNPPILEDDFEDEYSEEDFLSDD
jgi:phospholipid-binding lipoprotein MlaA